MLKKLSFFLSVLILSFAFGYFIFAWTEPGSTPPGGNVPAPINVGPDTQTKTGGLNLGGDLTVSGTLNIGSYGDIYSDSSWLRLNQNHTQNIYTPRIIRADGGLYVSDDERIYRCSEDYVCTDDNFMVTGGGWLRVDGSEGLYFQSYGGGWRMTDSTWIRSYGGKRVYVDSIVRADGGFQVDGTTVIGGDAWIEGDRIRQNTIDGSEIQDNTLTASDLAANSCGNSELIDNPTFNDVNVNGTLRIQYTRVDRACNNRYCKATCSSGWRVVGGGCESSGGVVMDDRPEYRFRSDWDRSWVCYGGDGVIIETTYAICLKIQQP